MLLSLAAERMRFSLVGQNWTRLTFSVCPVLGCRGRKHTHATDGLLLTEVPQMDVCVFATCQKKTAHVTAGNACDGLVLLWR